MATWHPNGYGTQMVTLDRLREIHAAKMHPEYARRLFAWLSTRPGVGIGGGWRSTQPDKPGFAPDGKSFHQSQTFASGIVGYAAVDLVVAVPGQVHRAPTWAECDDAPAFGLHTFIKIPPEPWHMQCVEMRGWQTWVDRGRLDPQPIPLPTDPPPEPEPEPEPPEEDEMPKLRRVAGSTATLIIDGSIATWVKKGDAIGPALADGLIVDGRDSDIPVAALGVLTLFGPVGGYSQEPGRTLEITAAHFAGQIL